MSTSRKVPVRRATPWQDVKVYAGAVLPSVPKKSEEYYWKMVGDGITFVGSLALWLVKRHLEKRNERQNLPKY